MNRMSTWLEEIFLLSLLPKEDKFLHQCTFQVKRRVSLCNLVGYEPWYCIATSNKYASPSTAEVEAPLERIPIFQRGGSIIPKKERLRRSSTQMVDDPYTLVVALDSHSQADGELYIDDYHSFDYKKGHFLRRKFTFANNKLTSEAIGTEKFGATNTVERVVILGVTQQPSKVTLETKGKIQDLQFFLEGETLTIRKPDVPIVDNWSITLL